MLLAVKAVSSKRILGVELKSYSVLKRSTVRRYIKEVFLQRVYLLRSIGRNI